MVKKFLVFSCVVLLASIVYFIYTSYQWHIKDKDLQEAAMEEAPPLEYVSTIKNDSTSHTLERYNPDPSSPEPTTEEWTVFEATGDFKGSEEYKETTQSEFQSETEDDQAGISPELEALFTGVKSLINQLEVIRREAAPYVEEHAKVKYRQIEIGTRDLVDADKESTEQLHEEFRQNQERMKQLMDRIKPFEEQKRQLTNRFQEENDMTFSEFKERYNEDYRLWKAGL